MSPIGKARFSHSYPRGLSGRSVAWYRVCFGSRRPQVQILSSRPEFEKIDSLMESFILPVAYIKRGIRRSCQMPHRQIQSHRIKAYS